MHLHKSSDLSFNIFPALIKLIIHAFPVKHNLHKSGLRLPYTFVITEFDLTGRDSWFPTKFWIFTTEFFVIMILFTKRLNDEILWNYRWICDIEIIWKLSQPFEHWTKLIVFIFLYWFFPYCSQSSQLI